MRGYRVSVPSRAALKRTVFLERASSSFGPDAEDEGHDTLPGPFAPELLRVRGVGRVLGAAVEQGVADVGAAGPAFLAALDVPLVRELREREPRADEPVAGDPAPPAPAPQAELGRLTSLRRAFVRRRALAFSSLV
jgi:HAMP domain-containing protein